MSFRELFSLVHVTLKMLDDFLFKLVKCILIVLILFLKDLEEFVKVLFLKIQPFQEALFWPVLRTITTAGATCHGDVNVILVRM